MAADRSTEACGIHPMTASPHPLHQAVKRPPANKCRRLVGGGVGWKTNAQDAGSPMGPQRVTVANLAARAPRSLLPSISRRCGQSGVMHHLRNLIPSRCLGYRGEMLELADGHAAERSELGGDRGIANEPRDSSVSWRNQRISSRSVGDRTARFLQRLARVPKAAAIPASGSPDFSFFIRWPLRATPASREAIMYAHSRSR